MAGIYSSNFDSSGYQYTFDKYNMSDSMHILEAKILELLRINNVDVKLSTCKFIKFLKYGGDAGWIYEYQSYNGSIFPTELHFFAPIREFYNAKKEIYIERNWLCHKKKEIVNKCKHCKGHGFILDGFYYVDKCEKCNV